LLQNVIIIKLLHVTLHYFFCFETSLYPNTYEFWFVFLSHSSRLLQIVLLVADKLGILIVACQRVTSFYVECLLKYTSTYIL